MRPSHTTEQCRALTPGVPSLNTMPHTEPSRPTSTPCCPATDTVAPPCWAERERRMGLAWG